VILPSKSGRTLDICGIPHAVGLFAGGADPLRSPWRLSASEYCSACTSRPEQPSGERSGVELDRKSRAQPPSSGECVQVPTQLPQWESGSIHRLQHLSELRAAQLAPSEKSLTKECGWKDGDRGGPAQRRKKAPGREKQNHLDSNRPSHGGTTWPLLNPPTVLALELPCFVDRASRIHTIKRLGDTLIVAVGDDVRRGIRIEFQNAQIYG
jgi:hypothetical protein